MPLKTRKNRRAGKNAVTRKIRGFIKLAENLMLPYKADSCKKLEASASADQKRRNEEKKVKAIMIKNPLITTMSSKNMHKSFKQMKKILDFSKDELLKIKKKYDNRPCMYDKESGVYKQNIQANIQANIQGLSDNLK